MDVANREVRNSANKKEEFVHSATENNFSQSSNKKAQIEENSPTANTCDVLNNKGDIFREEAVNENMSSESNCTTENEYISNV